MSDEPQRPDLPKIPLAMPARSSRWPPQLIWLIPLAAVVIGGWLAVTTILEQGPTITITFKTGEGIVPGKTKIKYKDVDVGIIKSVTVAEDLKTAIVSAVLAKAAEKHLVDDTRFWCMPVSRAAACPDWPRCSRVLILRWMSDMPRPSAEASSALKFHR